MTPRQRATQLAIDGMAKPRPAAGVASHTISVNLTLSTLSEAQFQRAVRAVLSQLGFQVWVFPIMKRTMAGVPDLTFWHPSWPGRLWMWELKRESRAVISLAQQAAIDHLTTVPGVDARIVRPSDWPVLRDSLTAALGVNIDERH